MLIFCMYLTLFDKAYPTSVQLRCLCYGIPEKSVNTYNRTKHVCTITKIARENV